MRDAADADTRPSPPLIVIPFNISPALDQIRAAPSARRPTDAHPQ